MNEWEIQLKPSGFVNLSTPTKKREYIHVENEKKNE